MFFQALFFIIIGALAIFGLYQIAKYIEYKILSPAKNAVVITLIPLTGHIENAEFVIRNTNARIQAQDFGDKTIVAIVDMGMDEETREICESVCNSSRDMALFEKDQMKGILSQL